MRMSTQAPSWSVQDAQENDPGPCRLHLKTVPEMVPMYALETGFLWSQEHGSGMQHSWLGHVLSV